MRPRKTTRAVAIATVLLGLALMVATWPSKAQTTPVPANALPPCVPAFYGETAGREDAVRTSGGWYAYWYCWVEVPDAPADALAIDKVKIAPVGIACEHGVCDPSGTLSRLHTAIMATDPVAAVKALWTQYVTGPACNVATSAGQLQVCAELRKAICTNWPAGGPPGKRDGATAIDSSARLWTADCADHWSLASNLPGPTSHPGNFFLARNARQVTTAWGTLVLNYGGAIYHRNAASQWYRLTPPETWVAVAGDPRPQPPPPPPPPAPPTPPAPGTFVVASTSICATADKDAAGKCVRRATYAWDGKTRSTAAAAEKVDIGTQCDPKVGALGYLGVLNRPDRVAPCVKK